jgi:hypothetical protein
MIADMDLKLSRFHRLTGAHLVLGLCLAAYAAIEGEIPIRLNYLPIVPGWPTYFYLITITLLQAVVVLTTLLAVRRLDYRLTRRPTRSL